MSKRRMAFLREVVNKLIISEHPKDEELLYLSQELDKLILRSIKESTYSKCVLGEGFMKEFDAIIDKLQLFEKMYESMRIVDPVTKKVLELNEKELCETDGVCHGFWHKGMVCDNCISMRAYNEDDTIFKIEHNCNHIYMVTAVPISINGKRLIVEFLKNATNNLYIKLGNHENEIKILTTIEYMNQAAVKDELTSLYNRRYINEKLPVDLLNSSIHDEILSIIFADLDFFKSINDTYGHSAGDQILQEFAEELKKHVRNGKDWIARYGGEEFMICLPNTDLETARAIAERIRISVMEKEFVIGSAHIHLTCSFGVHAVQSGDMCLTVDDIIELADTKLYQAKREGRNRVV